MNNTENTDAYIDENLIYQGEVLKSGDGEYTVKGYINNAPNGAILTYWAANPPTFCTSYAGSALPYANPLMAYENTPNKGSVKVINGEFEFRVYYPNAYYAGLGSIYVNPHVNIKLYGSENSHKIELGNGIPFRTLTYAPPPTTNPRSNPLFYAGRESLPVRNQEQILRSSAYPEKNIYPDNFWGLKPPQ